MGESSTTDGADYGGADDNPKTAADSWAYEVRRAHWPALGIRLKSLVDKERTTAARAAAIKSGMSKRDANGISIRHTVIEVADPPRLRVQAGDTFHPNLKVIPPLQIMGEDDIIEVHEVTNESPPRKAYTVTSKALLTWLQTGRRPHDAKRIGPWQSKRPVLFMAIQDVA